MSEPDDGRLTDDNDTDRNQPQVGPAKPGDSPSQDDDVQADREQGDELPR